MRSKNIIGLVVLAVLVGTLLFGVLNYQKILDDLALRNYTAPERIAKLADDTTMNAKTRRLFYVNHPELNDKSTFNGHCRTTEQSIVLGCYVERQGIFLLDVSDPRLSGVVEVTAAHEVLHAAYDRLGKTEKARVDKLTTEFFATLADERIKTTVENYRKKDANIVPNELHSILGSEVLALSPELEDYYAQYFTDRKKIVAYSKQYEQTFINLKDQVSSYDDQLARLKETIEGNEQLIDARNNDLAAERRRLDNLLAGNQADAYNDAVPGFNQMVGEYNALIVQTRGLITRYNKLVEERNSVVTQEQELVEAIDSSRLKEEQ